MVCYRNHLILTVARMMCGSCSQKKDEIRNEEKELTVAISADTGSMDPAGSIALTYLAYSESNEAILFQLLTLLVTLRNLVSFV